MFNPADPYTLPYNMFQEIDKNWMLISAKAPDGRVNTMTAHWGMVGDIFNKLAVTIYIQQTRYTKEFVDTQDYFTLSLFDGDTYRPQLTVLGTKSGRDGDKIAEVGFTVEEVDGQPTFKESKCVLICKKVYQDDIDLSKLAPETNARFYPTGITHTMYIGEIVGCYVNE